MGRVTLQIWSFVSPVIVFLFCRGDAQRSACSMFPTDPTALLRFPPSGRQWKVHLSAGSSRSTSMDWRNAAVRKATKERTSCRGSRTDTRRVSANGTGLLSLGSRRAATRWKRTRATLVSFSMSGIAFTMTVSVSMPSLFYMMMIIEYYDYVT